jgi:hypothetical protein
MAVPFSFSVSDFIAVAELAAKISTALSDVRGSESEYKSLIKLLELLNASLRTVYIFVVSSSSMTGLPPPDAALVNQLKVHLRLL